MKQVYYFDQEFLEEEVHKLTAFLNNLQSGDEVHFYLDSPGGYNHVMEVIKSMLENSEFPITLIATGEIQSAAFLLFYFSKLNKVILPNTIAMAHTLTKIYEDRDIRQNSKYYIRSKKQLDDMNQNVIDKFRAYNVLSPEDMEDYIKGEDVLILYEELIDIMKNCPYGTYRETIP